ncbi:MAG: 50S ribosomal protein L22 [Candidatus Shapirobacteria bacterium GW2011_GWE1_38_10]|uniref:50S ribosomal protein L22 n=1 Tax=Candidatus Shapirobacteria bacterium GW2011_GWE1_38_10 TaxID=1618488 RepID=A0A0G0LBX9_9BACT|nr:MAG: 50S ribosomal protein L22 [Candidatus Shapirobacteria bacterium GW2011_GWF2_37_20]KKQ50146.1 MAG: 50S ribosomal protein L22 [Candidatus Shapirobacteria bacterium GW2011_GWE1_38_10]KKQ64739.1 MAG: 50S ribosomal protein L22 [Candidatus Shapirobacteria bacterium GW2011_GWF1_38_23]
MWLRELLKRPKNMAKEITKKTITKKTTVKKEVDKKTNTTPVVAAPEFKLSVYTDKNIKISPRKLRLLASSIKKLKPLDASIKLSLTNTKAARILTSALKTVVSTAKNNYNLLPESLIFDSIQVDEGPKIKRMDKSHGSHFSRGIITKRHSRLIIIVKGQVK